MEIELDTHVDLIKSYAWVAFHKMKRSSRLDFDDILQEGIKIFLEAKNSFLSDRNMSFRSYLIQNLRQRFCDIVKKSYKPRCSKEITFHNTRTITKSEDPVEIVHVRLLLENLTGDEKEYVKAMVSLPNTLRKSRRRIAREAINISYDREVSLRNSIRDKVRK